jgi:hypothetical protein
MHGVETGESKRGRSKLSVLEAFLMAFGRPSLRRECEREKGTSPIIAKKLDLSPLPIPPVSVVRSWIRVAANLDVPHASAISCE